MTPTASLPAVQAGRLRWGRAAPADVWLHGASVGDLRALAPLVQALEARDLRLHLTAQTAGGRAIAHQLFGRWPVSAPPLDCPRRALAALRPRLVVLEYLELWPAWLAACHRAAVPVVVVDGRVSHRSLRIKGLLRPWARHLAAFCAQTAADGAGARALGVPADRVHVCGNAKHDGARQAVAPSAALRAAVGAVDVVVGSLQPDEEAAALAALAASGLRALIAPRYPERSRAICRRAARLGVSARRRTEAPAGAAQWIVLDTLGELAAAYALGAVAVMGGTFGRRDGQNLVEAAAHGRPVIHGPRVGNVRVEAEALAGLGGWPVQGWAEAFAVAQARLITPGPDPREALGGLTGATARQLAVIEPWLDVDPWPDR